jgi:uncharacterized oligopeptide transporter (OPT) family protein
MEFFLPGLAALLIAALLVFLILPRLGAPVLAILSLVLLAYGVWSHMTLFYSEYRYSTWQNRLAAYAPFIVLGFLIIGVLAYLLYIFGTVGSAALPASNLTPAQTTSVNSTINSVANSIGLSTNKKNNSGTVLENLGGILNTPNKRNSSKSLL